MENDKDLRLASVPGEETDFEKGSIFFVGTATVVLRYAGFTILTDPNFLHAGEHVHLGYGLFSKRLTNPAREIDELPRLDLCILSHYHGDHFDRVAQERLDKDLPILTTPHAASALARKGFRRALGVDRWSSVAVTKGEAVLRLTSMPGRHGPGLVNALLPPVMGSMLEFGKVGGRNLWRLYVSGDTLLHEELEEIPHRHPGVIDLALLHLGGTKLLGLVTVTMDAPQGVEILRLLRPLKAIPIHYDDYTVFKSPLADFRRAVSRAGLDAHVVYLVRGQSHEFEVPAARALRRAVNE